jgi:hypothetical protein
MKARWLCVSVFLFFCFSPFHLFLSCTPQTTQKEAVADQSAESALPDAAEGMAEEAQAEAISVEEAQAEAISVEAEAEVSVEPSTPESIAPEKEIGPDLSLTAFLGEHIFFGSENRRMVDKTITFPAAHLAYKKITLQFSLRCPNNRCDFWDRFGSLGIVLNPHEEEKKVVEISRFVTAYRVASTWRVDITRLRPLLAGSVTLRVFIDTWVGPGHAQGEGWLVDASFGFEGGLSDDVPSAAIPVWPLRSFVYGDPKKPVQDAVPPSEIAIPAKVRKAELMSFITGHGQGNLQNCAEFCQKDHTFQIGAQRWTQKIWRADCPSTATPNQAGTWTYPRAGWCPGASAHPWVVDVTDAVKAGEKQTVMYEVEAYTNTCRPDSPQCTGCMQNWGNCDYNYNGHTEPYYQFSSLLLIYP